MLLGSLDSGLPPQSDRASLRRPMRQLSLGQEPLPASPLISTRNLVPGLSESVVQLDMLGRGATSNVFLAVHAATLKMLALKEVTVSNAEDRRAVRTEVRTLKTQRSPLLNSTFTTELASCPRIVDYYGSVVLENGNACIAVEYVAGGSLENWVERSGKSACPEAWFAHIAYQALEALEFLHSNGRVHRDVKPANLLITRNGDLKLGDFGAAGVENSSRMVGTQRFMAPERLKGHGATAQSDLWSLGLSLATAALGDDFISQGSNHFEQLDLAGRVRRTLAKATTLSAEMTDFLHSCLSRDPARRPALRELMEHPFLSQRQGWQTKCPEVALAMRDHKRLQGGDRGAMSTEEVLDALCNVRAEENLIGTSFSPETTADLAYELGVTANSLVRNVHRRTLKFIRERGGGGGVSGVSDSGGENGDELRGGGGRRRTTVRGGGIVSEEARRRRRRSAARDAGASNLCGAADEHEEKRPHCERRRDQCCSPLPEPPQAETLALRIDVTSTASIGDRSTQRSEDCGHSSYPLVTPRNRPTGAAVTGIGSFGTRQTASLRRSRRRGMEMTSAVKLTPHKRRGERKASQTKRNGSCCAADGIRLSGRMREKEPHFAAGTDPETPVPGSTERQQVTAAVETAAGVVSVPVSSTNGHRCLHNASTSVSTTAHTLRSEDGHEQAEPRRRSWERRSKNYNKPRTAVSRTLPSRADVRMRSMQGVFRLADEMKAQIAVRDRVHRLRVYPNCFSGREAVQWMLDGCHASSVIEAENIGNEMMKASVFQHILNSHVFEDSSVYYQFTDGDTPPPPSRGSRRLRQIARVFGGHVARKLVNGSGSGGTGAPVIVVVGGDGSSDTSGNGSGAGVDAANPTASGVRGIEAGDCARRATAGSRASSWRGGVPNQQLADSMPGDRNSKGKRRSRGRGSLSVGQLRRFSSSVSTLTVPETPC